MRVDGVGLGLRFSFAEELVTAIERGDELFGLSWLEIHPENYMRRGGEFPRYLELCLARYPVVTHGLSMSLGSSAPFDPNYLSTLKVFLHKIKTPWHSEHACISLLDGAMSHELIPVPMTFDVAKHVAKRLKAAQDFLELPIAIENVSFYATVATSELDEAAFIRAICEEADCPLMLDVNNVYVNAFNHHYDALNMILRMPLERVVQIHVAGHDYETEDMILDTHGQSVREEVYVLLQAVLQRTGQVPILLERDQEIPPLHELLREVQRLHTIWRESPRQGLATSWNVRVQHD